ncbi:MAG: hypothetical protein KI793_13255 [Rivularia sp. (in: Bacteria)]|nr:hypothetical protein [Rivularia sp. MS3]
MDKAEVVKVLQKAISYIRENRRSDAIKELHILQDDLERRIKEDDFDNEYDEYIVDENN